MKLVMFWFCYHSQVRSSFNSVVISQGFNQLSWKVFLISCSTLQTQWGGSDRQKHETALVVMGMICDVPYRHQRPQLQWIMGENMTPLPLKWPFWLIVITPICLSVDGVLVLDLHSEPTSWCRSDPLFCSEWLLAVRLPGQPTIPPPQNLEAREQCFCFRDADQRSCIRSQVNGCFTWSPAPSFKVFLPHRATYSSESILSGPP